MPFINENKIPGSLFICTKGLCCGEFSGLILLGYSSLCPTKSKNGSLLNFHEMLMGCLEIKPSIGFLLRPLSPRCYSLSVEFIFSTQQSIKMTLLCSDHRVLALAALHLCLEMFNVSLCVPMSLHHRLLTSRRHLFFDTITGFCSVFFFFFFNINMGVSYMS